MAMSLQCPIPSNINPLSPNGFLFTLTKLPEVSFFCQQINLPGINLGEPEFVNPFSKQPIPGDTITFDPISIQFLVDEDMKNFISIYDWIMALGFPENYDQYKELVGTRARGQSELMSNFSDGTLIILGANNTKIREVYFTDMFPTNLDSLTFSTTNTDVQYLIGNAQFRFGYYKII